MTTIGEEEVRNAVVQALSGREWNGQRVLLVVPDGTRTAPIGLMFREIHAALKGRASAVDVIFALGTHPPMREEDMLRRLEISPRARADRYASVRLMNHAWDDPGALVKVGVISAREVEGLSEGRLSMEVPVTIHRAALEYSRLILVGPVFPHEVVGFSGGHKYLFPGIGGPELLNFFHWLGALVTNPEIIGRADTPVRETIERAADLVPTPRIAFCLVVRGGDLVGLESGPPQEAWRRAAALSAQANIVYKPRPFHTVLSCAPPMYEDLWVGGKCVYKLEPVVADSGEIIVYGPHIRHLSPTHGGHIERIGYHVRDYFTRQWDRFRHEPWGVLAHSTHVRGVGTYEDGQERPRIRVTLATGIPERTCRRVNLGYRDPATIRPETFAAREDEGVLMVPRAGEVLYRLC